uniref:Uncharacterized protein n=1 Tax=Arundo donax TaxID=35708 RepID=A0A0A9CRY6_ARUDO
MLIVMYSRKMYVTCHDHRLIDIGVCGIAVNSKGDTVACIR